MQSETIKTGLAAIGLFLSLDTLGVMSMIRMWMGVQ